MEEALRIENEIEMIILNAGVPRSGTVLVNAMLRQIHELAGRHYQSLNHSGRDLERLLAKASGLNSSRRSHIFHMHDWNSALQSALSETRRPVICFANRRDPRDVCVSLMKLHDNSLNHSIRLTLKNINCHLAMLNDIAGQVIHYETDVANPANLVLRLSKSIDIHLNDQQIEDIVEATSIKVHRKIMKDVASKTFKDVRLIRNQSRVLREHKNMHINDRHIQSGLSGRWRVELSGLEQEQVTNALAPAIEKLGYEV